MDLLSLVTRGWILFSNNCRILIGNNFISSFSHTTWHGDCSLKKLFSDLFSVSLLQEISVAGMEVWIDRVWRWGDFGILVSSIIMVVFRAQFLRNCLESFTHDPAVRDLPVWYPNCAGGYSMRPYYALISSFLIPFGPPNEFHNAWPWIGVWRYPSKLKRSVGGVSSTNYRRRIFYVIEVFYLLLVFILCFLLFNCGTVGPFHFILPYIFVGAEGSVGMDWFFGDSEFLF
ncbi:hypothetical protein RYX36_001166 [Vicia faba]